MSLRINNNIASINAQRNLLKNDMAISKSLEKLSSGLRINRASDDAAGLVISEQMRAQITGLSQAVDNSETAVSMVQTAEGALDEINSLMNKARELILHAANEGANDVNQLVADQDELDNVLLAIQRISEFTQFGTKKLLDGSLKGSSQLSNGVVRVEVGNLANNAAVASGSIQMDIDAFTQEANVLAGGGVATGGRIFTGDVTGMDLGSNQVVTGSVATLTVNGLNYPVNVGTTPGTTGGAITKETLAGLWDDLIGDDFSVSYDTTNLGFRVTRNDDRPLSTDFAASVSFTRAGVASVTGTGARVTSQVTLTAGTSSNAAALLFSGSSVDELADMTASSVVDAGVSFKYVVGDSDGNTITGTIAASGLTVSQVMTQMQAAIAGTTGLAFALSGSQVSFQGATASGFNIRLELGDDTISDQFTFAVQVDYDNAPSNDGELRRSAVINGFTNTGGVSTFRSAAGTGGSAIGTLAGAAPTAVLVSGNAMTLTVNGQAVTVTAGAGGSTLSSLAGSLEAALNALTGLAGEGSYQIAFATGGAYSGLGGFGTSVFAGHGNSTAGTFVVGNSQGVDFDFQVTVDQAIGSDVDYTDVEVDDGASAGATLNLVTTNQSYASNTATVIAIPDATHNNATTVNTNGSPGNITLTDRNGGTVELTQTNTTACGLTTFTMASGGSILGITGVKIELDQALALAGGSASFVLDDGAIFQIGANEGQRVGVTIRSVAIGELGRNAVGSGIINSMEDMLSTKQAVLLNGMYDQSLAVLDQAIDEITTLRGALGAFQSNTLETGLSSLRITHENLTSAESTIRDVDFAAESAKFTRNQILVQASTAMLSQANQLPQNVLQLIQG